jgi:hypothetical protein
MANEQMIEEEKKRKKPLTGEREVQDLLQGVTNFEQQKQEQAIVEAANAITEKKAVELDQKAQGAELLATNEKARTEAVKKAKENLPVHEADKVSKEMSDPAKIVDSLERSEDKKQKGEEPSTKDSFMEAISFFLPTAIGAVGGALLGGTDAAIAGATEAERLSGAFRQHQLKKEELGIKKQKIQRAGAGKAQQSSFVDKQGNPITFDPATNEFKTLSGRKAQQGDFVDPVSARQAERMILAEKNFTLKEVKQKHGIDKDKQLSEKQLTKFSEFDNSDSQLSEMESFIGKVTTGPLSGRVQSGLIGLGKDAPEVVQLRTMSEAFVATFAKATQGGVLSESDITYAKKIVPTINDTPSTFKAKVAAMKRMVKLQRDTYANSIKRGQPLKTETVRRQFAAIRKDTDKILGKSKPKSLLSPEKQKRKEELLAKQARRK